MFHKKDRFDPQVCGPLAYRLCSAEYFCKISWCGLWPNILYKRSCAGILADHSEIFGIANPHSSLLWVGVYRRVGVLYKGNDFRSIRSLSYVLRYDESFRRALCFWVLLPVFSSSSLTAPRNFFQMGGGRARRAGPRYAFVLFL